MKAAEEIIRGHLNCTCDEIYKSRKMTDPSCFLCGYESEIELMMQEYGKEIKNRTQLIYIELTRIIIIIALTIITIWYIKQGLDQTQAKKVESFIEHSEITP